MSNSWTILGLGTIKGHPKCHILSQVTMPQMSQVLRGACHWHVGCRDVHQSSSCTAQCPLSDHRPFKSWFPTDWHYCKSTSSSSATCDRSGTRWPHPARPSAGSGSDRLHVKEMCCSERRSWTHKILKNQIPQPEPYHVQRTVNPLQMATAPCYQCPYEEQGLLTIYWEGTYILWNPNVHKSLIFDMGPLDFWSVY